jgi:hypothetical protein
VLHLKEHLDKCQSRWLLCRLCGLKLLPARSYSDFIRMSVMTAEHAQKHEAVGSEEGASAATPEESVLRQDWKLGNGILPYFAPSPAISNGHKELPVPVLKSVG